MKFLGAIVVAIMATSTAYAQTVFTVDMDGTQANGGVGTGSTFTGSGTVTLNGTEDQITVALTHNITPANVTIGHIHIGPVGVEGGIVFGFSGAASPINQVFAISPAQVAILEGSGYYVNIHTIAFGAGEIRGQILPPPVPMPATSFRQLAAIVLLVIAVGLFAFGLRRHLSRA
jgi:hypothetical protein